MIYKYINRMFIDLLILQSVPSIRFTSSKPPEEAVLFWQPPENAKAIKGYQKRCSAQSILCTETWSSSKVGPIQIFFLIELEHLRYYVITSAPISAPMPLSSVDQRRSSVPVLQDRPSKDCLPATASNKGVMLKARRAGEDGCAIDETIV